jgi:uncharacterized protein
LVTGEEAGRVKWNVAQLLKSAVGTDREYTVEDERHPSTEIASPVQGTVRLMRTDSGILAMGHFQTAVWYTCSRCVDRSSQDIEFELDEEFTPSVDIDNGGRIQPRDDGGFTLTDMHELDLAEPVRQYAILELSLNPLCSPSCRGLCSQCGANLNTTDCGCDVTKADPRWDGLEALRIKLSAN